MSGLSDLPEIDDDDELARIAAREAPGIVAFAHEHEDGWTVTYSCTWPSPDGPLQGAWGDVLGGLADPADPTSWTATWPTEEQALEAADEAMSAAVSRRCLQPGWTGPTLAGYGRNDDGSYVQVEALPLAREEAGS